MIRSRDSRTVVLPLAAALALALGGCGSERGPQAPAGTGDGTPDGAQLFAQSGCGGCHTLSAAGTGGTVGPNLDRRMPTVEEAARAIASGRPGMPPYRGRLSEAETQALARFVSESTRR